MTAAIVPASFENVHETGQVCVHIRMRMGQGMPNPSLRGEVNHKQKTVPLEQGGDPSPVDKIELFERKPLVFAKNREPALLERGIIVIVQVVQPDDPVACVQKALRC